MLLNYIYFLKSPVILLCMIFIERQKEVRCSLLSHHGLYPAKHLKTWDWALGIGYPLSDQALGSG